jgi:hypothetical protein
MHPNRTVELAGRAASLVLAIALAANVLLVAVARDKDWFVWTITVASALAAVGMLHRVFAPANRLSTEAAWLGTGVWVANLVEIATDEFVRTASQIRLGGFYFAFALGCALMYLVERLAKTTDVAVPAEP